MRKADGGFGFEDIVFLCAALASLVAAGAALLLRHHLDLHKDRVRYGVEHLPAALVAVFLFTVLTGLLRAFLARSAGRSNGLAERPTFYYMGLLVAIFTLCWLSVVLAGGFVQDDWMLLAAASVRKIIYLHPGYSWYALDSVDGNFRPLGTVLYFGYMLHWFGPSAQAFLAGSFLLNLLGSLVAFLIVREMGYSKVAGAAASLLYMSRGLIYTIVSWAAALGDSIVILLCGLMALAILKANKREGAAAVGYHLLAWGCFFLATLGKQSAFAAPLIVALLLFLRPGQALTVSLARRAGAAIAGLVVYAGTAAIAFFHAKALLQAPSPYPIAFSTESLLRSFAYVTWYLATFEFPEQYHAANLLPRIVGFALLAGGGVLVWKVPGLLGERPRDVLFAMLAAVASLSLFIVLGTRVAPYYGSMSGFWVSIGVGIMLTRMGAPRLENLPGRLCCLAFCLLVVLGFADIRVKQTGLIPAGGYTWGTFGMDWERAQFGELQRRLVAAPQKTTLVLVDFPGYPSYYASMALLADARMQRILVYDSGRRTYLANDLQGRRPKDERGALNDAQAYNWTLPIARPTLSQDEALWLQFRDGKIEPGDSIQSTPR